MFVNLFVVCLCVVPLLAQALYKDSSDVNVVLMVNGCRNRTSDVSFNTQSLVNAAIWTTQRINFLEVTNPLKFGLSVIQTCTQKDSINAVFNMYNSSEENYLVGLISEERLDLQVEELSDVLGIKTTTLPKVYKHMVKSAVEFLGMMNWYQNVTVIVDNERILSEFYTFTTRKFICVNNYFTLRRNHHTNYNISSDTVVFFGNNEEIHSFINETEDKISYNNILIVPTDGSVPRGLPTDSYVIIPNYTPLSKNFKKTTNVELTPQLFDIASPLLNFAYTIGDYLKENCNDTFYKLNCLRSKFNNDFPRRTYPPSEILDDLKIQPLEEHFVYNVYVVDVNNDTESLTKNNFLLPLTKVFTFNFLTGKWFVHNVSVIQENLELHNETIEYCKENANYCINNCKNYLESYLENQEMISETIFSQIIIRTDAWVYAFLSLSVLGILFCIAILSFILISICRRDILEGNPTLTITLLIAVMLMFLSVLPFCVNVTSGTARDVVCLLKALAVTLTYALAYSLLLSRCILLASASKEIGFMSHVSGSVQSFLCLFIFGVQIALSIQIIGRCADFFRGYTFIFFMSYDIMLLMLLLCLCPLIYKCQRNYREGKYFVIAICLTTIVWCFWLPLYCCMGHNWKEPILCFGVVSTASIFLGSIFIPRTYLMTIANARDKITSRLPSLATATSAIDIYRANTQVARLRLRECGSHKRSQRRQSGSRRHNNTAAGSVFLSNAAG
ncbi:protein bride of sevenless isoform X2 [Aethina tumida]|uniref:protein bride of sevenless isoform X2 n=1 Tax=Aethina tumida TaxID=116153 RepID=UPI002147A0F7|nr:protein bride of sevenless isoform X2 [Aethina tumida]